jgi:hypothetical protein
MVSRYLERFGHEALIDHRSLEVQGIDREPTSHVGPTATDFEREGVKTERGNIKRKIKERNRQRELENQRSAARLGTTLYDRVDMASMQRDAMSHLQDTRRMQQRAGGLRPLHSDDPRRRLQAEQERQRQMEERNRRDRVDAIRASRR